MKLKYFSGLTVCLSPAHRSLTGGRETADTWSSTKPVRYSALAAPRPVTRGASGSRACYLTIHHSYEFNQFVCFGALRKLAPMLLSVYIDGFIAEDEVFSKSE